MQIHSEQSIISMSSNEITKYVIFDLDGTLIDSYNSICRSICKTLDLLNVTTLSTSDILHFRGESLSDLFKFAFMKTAGHITKESFKNLFDSIYNDDCCENVSIINPAYDYLVQAIAKGYQIIIFTNKRQDIANKICNSLFPTIKFTIIGRTNPTSKKSDFIDRLPLAELIDCYYGDSVEDKLIADSLSINFIKIKYT